MLRFYNSLAVVLVAAVVATAASAQQPGVSLSPFVTFPRNGDAGPLAGLTIGVTDGPFSVRASGQFSMRDRAGLSTANASLVMRPWSADADALLYFARNDSDARLALTPYVFAGVGTTTTDSSVFHIRRGGWSYGAGTGLPLFSTLSAFAEARWRMSEYVLPTAPGAPKPSLETRVGLSFRVGSGGAGLASLAEALIATAESYIGTPFRRGDRVPPASTRGDSCASSSDDSALRSRHNSSSRRSARAFGPSGAPWLRATSSCSTTSAASNTSLSMRDAAGSFTRQRARAFVTTT